MKENILYMLEILGKFVLVLIMLIIYPIIGLFITIVFTKYFLWYPAITLLIVWLVRKRLKKRKLKRELIVTS